ncbi:MAG TPA: hypothetical protein PLU87_00080 [Sedimentisphaerales bacterium]|nr:hypothetical protein [Sedimentisphaerales bacterium]HRS13097.1 hypothetical protein [Sedimentisphaerales bacterium]HRV46407.1 hypothetical protein [Sedimentisphaerales bacterium]
MREVSFDKDRAEALMAAKGRRQPLVGEGRDLFLLAGGLKGVASPPQGEHIDHLELEVEQGCQDLLASVMFVSTWVLDLRTDEYDEHFKAKVAAEIELTQKPRYLVRDLW